MKLYHFTSWYHLAKILSEGEISRGEVPLSATRVLNGVNLTSDENPIAQEWAGSADRETRMPTSQAIKLGFPILEPDSATQVYTQGVDKRAIRLALEIPTQQMQQQLALWAGQTRHLVQNLRYNGHEVFPGIWGANPNYQRNASLLIHPLLSEPLFNTSHH